MQHVAHLFREAPRPHGILGRVYKDSGRIEGKDLESCRIAKTGGATRTSSPAPFRSYDRRRVGKFDTQGHQTVVSFVKLLAFLKDATGRTSRGLPASTMWTHLTVVVRFRCPQPLESAGHGA